MTLAQARNVALMLSDEPLYYRNFGVWWWWVKRELRRLGFEQFVGPFEDQGCAEHYYDGMGPDELDREAFAYQLSAATTHRNEPMATAPDGEVYLLHDQDLE